MFRPQRSTKDAKNEERKGGFSRKKEKKEKIGLMRVDWGEKIGGRPVIALPNFDKFGYRVPSSLRILRVFAAKMAFWNW